MELSASEDIEIPLDQLFAKVSDFSKIEKMAMRRGVDVQRTDRASSNCVGMSWRAQFKFRGKSREALITLEEYDPPQSLRFHTVSDGLDTDLTIDLVALSRQRTRLSFSAALQPKTLSARLLVQSFKLARGRIDRKLGKRMAGLARDLEEGRI
jgi:hypothetical protein